MRKLLRRLDADAERYLMLVFYCTVVFVIVNEVVRRFVLQYSSLWGEEVARYAFIYLGWIGASQAVKDRAHIRFDSVLQLLPTRWHGYVYIFADVVTLVFACIAIYWSVQTI
ncbi:MAG: TRAP transporter small permease subunit, partial [Burkholderiales bacterium]